VEFTFGGLCFDHPTNAAIVSIVYPGQIELLDLAPFGDRPVEVRLEIPLAAAVVDAPPIPADPPTEIADEKGIQLANFCRDELRLAPDSRLLDIGCNYGRLAIALDDYLDRGGGEYEAFDPQREHVLWARQNLMPKHRSTSLHIANIRNRIYNPDGALSPTEFRFPYQDGRFDVAVAHSLFPYLLPEEFEHYAAEIARVLKPGGRLLATFFLLDEEAREITLSLADPHCFRYTTGPITTTGPNRGGLAAYDEKYVQDILRKNGIEVGPPIFGSWRERSGGRFREDAFVGIKLPRAQAER
jgi:SAM-dependent methyltransferase